MTTKVLTAHIPLPLAEKVDQLATRLGACRRIRHFGFFVDKSGKQYMTHFCTQVVLQSAKREQKWEDSISKGNSPTGS
jgi:hypothetical protein